MPGWVLWRTMAYFVSAVTGAPGLKVTERKSGPSGTSPGSTSVVASTVFVGVSPTTVRISTVRGLIGSNPSPIRRSTRSNVPVRPAVNDCATTLPVPIANPLKEPVDCS